MIVQHESVSYLEAIQVFSFEMVIEFLMEMANFVDIIFYSLSAYAAYRLSFKELEKQVKYGIVSLDQLRSEKDNTKQLDRN